jgi:hypothetical protein
MNQPTNRQFTVVSDDEPETGQKIASEAIMLALSALSQRTLQALASLFTLLTVGSAFWLALQVSNSPSIYQLVCLGLYLAFVLTINFIVRRR